MPGDIYEQLFSTKYSARAAWKTVNISTSVACEWFFELIRYNYSIGFPFDLSGAHPVAYGCIVAMYHLCLNTHKLRALSI